MLEKAVWGSSSVFMPSGRRKSSISETLTKISLTLMLPMHLGDSPPVLPSAPPSANISSGGLLALPYSYRFLWLASYCSAASSFKASIIVRRNSERACSRATLNRLVNSSVVAANNSHMALSAMVGFLSCRLGSRSTSSMSTRESNGRE